MSVWMCDSNTTTQHTRLTAPPSHTPTQARPTPPPIHTHTLNRGCPANWPVASLVLMLPLSSSTLMNSRPWRLPVEKSLGSWAGVILTAPACVCR